jgi:Yeast mitochondrial distribution and morphology (MDM) proteins
MWESALITICYHDASKLTNIIAGLMDEISLKVNILRMQLKVHSLNLFLQTYDALAYHVSQATMNRRRMKTVSLWSLQMTAGAVLSALRNSIHPMSAQLKEASDTSQLSPCS